MVESDELEQRFRANHDLLVAARDRLQAAVKAGFASAEQEQRLATVKELLAPVTVSEEDADGNVVEVQRPRQFLKVDPEGQGRAVEVLGDLQAAKNIAVLVPGMGNSLETFRGQSDRGRLIKDEAGPGTAVVVWLDYDSPHGLLEAASKEAALEGGPRLAASLNEIDQLKDENADVTVVAHSYGTDVAAQAVIEGGARPKRLVMTGSPGIETYIDEASDFVLPPTRLYTERAPGDYVAYSEWHGPDPANFDDAIRMATADPRGDDPVSVHWHNEYYRPNSEALRNIGRVVSGDLDHITTTRTGREAETELVLGTSWGGVLNKAAHAASSVYNGIASLARPSKESAAAAAQQAAASRPTGGAREGREL